MTLRKDLLSYLSQEPRSVSRLARELRLPRAEVEDALRHMIRSARAAGHRILVVPARCRACGFTFDQDKLTKPSRCPECKESRIFEPQTSGEGTRCSDVGPPFQGGRPATLKAWPYACDRSPQPIYQRSPE